MGSIHSTQNQIVEEYKKCSSSKRKKTERALVLDQLLSFQLKDQDHDVDVTHLGTLFMLDKNKDGKFELPELLEFGEVYYNRASAKKFQTDFQTEFRAFCTLHMWKAVCKPDGVDSFVNWFGKLFSENMAIQYFDKYPGVIFLNRDTIKTAHKLLSISQTYGMDFQSFFDLMQRVGEEQGFMSLNDVEFDDVVPLVVVRQFARDFIKGFMNLMKELGFDPDMRIE